MFTKQTTPDVLEAKAQQYASMRAALTELETLTDRIADVNSQLKPLLDLHRRLDTEYNLALGRFNKLSAQK